MRPQLRPTGRLRHLRGDPEQCGVAFQASAQTESTRSRNTFPLSKSKIRTSSFVPDVGPQRVTHFYG
jgi:hypothetical protein